MKTLLTVLSSYIFISLQKNIWNMPSEIEYTPPVTECLITYEGITIFTPDSSQGLEHLRLRCVHRVFVVLRALHVLGRFHRREQEKVLDLALL